MPSRPHVILAAASTNAEASSATEPLVTNDAVVLGLLLAILALVFATASSEVRFWKRFYSIVPSLFLCYFLPSILTAAKIVDPNRSQLYFIASRYLLPASLVLLTLSADLRGVLRLGPRAVLLFLTGTAGVVIGGPLTILIVSSFAPDLVGGQGPDAVWRGMTTIAGSWIGGGANQAAMKEVFHVGDDVFSVMVAVDVLVANVWMAVLLVLAGRSAAIDRRLGADRSAIEDLQARIAAFEARVARIPSTADLVLLAAVGLGVTGIAHFGADLLAPWIAREAPELEKLSLTSDFFWIVVIATTGGVLLSFTRARELEGRGASKIGTVFLYILVATIGMKMEIAAVRDQPGLFLVGGIWIAIHAVLMITVTLILRAPIFFLAVGSQANIGGAASAPIVASAFHPTLAPVGVLLAVVGYALGTYAAYVCGLLLQGIAGA